MVSKQTNALKKDYTFIIIAALPEWFLNDIKDETNKYKNLKEYIMFNNN